MGCTSINATLVAWQRESTVISGTSRLLRAYSIGPNTCNSHYTEIPLGILGAILVAPPKQYRLSRGRDSAPVHSVLYKPLVFF